MIYKLRTSEKTQNIFSKLSQASGLQPFALSKLAIAFSLRSGALTEGDYESDTGGLELNRQTIFGETELLFRCLIVQHEGKSLTDEEFFPKLAKAHLDRGAAIMQEESKYNRNFYLNLCQLDSNL